MRTTSPMKVLALALLGTVAFACVDPVHDAAVERLGPEDPTIQKGLRHRAGQPCLTCHGGDGPGEPEFSVAGTIYLRRDESEPLEGAIVTITDATGRARSITTNDVGNFRIERSSWKPVFPLKVQVSFDDEIAEMKTLVNGDGACSSCHRGDGDSSHVPRVYLRKK